MLSVKSDLKSGESAFHPVASPVGFPPDNNASDDPSSREISHPDLIPPPEATPFSWPSSVAYDEQRELLCTEEESFGVPSSEEEEEEASSSAAVVLDPLAPCSPPLFSSSSSSSSNAHLTSNANSNNKPLSSKSIWSITKEQLAYYTSQFRGMQPHPGGVIHGPLAKEFFEKSRLPINELRKIWQLSDVSKDGCLSLEEFLTAMHLVVLRRNDIQLPEELPPELNPSHIRNKLQGTKDPPESGPRQPKSPVNFDFNHRDLLKRDPSILAPVPRRRMSPDDEDESHGNPSSDDDEEEEGGYERVSSHRRQINSQRGGDEEEEEVLYEQLWNQEDAISTTEESLSSYTLRNNTQTAASIFGKDTDDELDGPLSLPPPSSLASSTLLNPLGLNKKEGSPPPPPPRFQGRTHARSSSLDLNHFSSSSSRAPPPPPPRYPSQQQQRGASAVSRALRLAGEDLLSSPSMNAKSYQQAIHNLKETNSIVARTINELHQEVSDTLEERIALEYQLEQLKAFGE